MPRYKFKWENLPADLQQAILATSAVETLDQVRRMWGARPDERFVGSNRTLLVRTWLANDDAARRSVVGKLKDRRLGSFQSRPRSAAGQLDYIESCNNSKAFRTILLHEFRMLGEHAPAAPSKPDNGEIPAYRGWRLVETTGEPPQFTPHQHQIDAWRALDSASPIRGGLLVLPTGAGKTITAVRWLLENVLGGSRPRAVLWIAHRAELLEQAASAFAQHAAIADRSEPLGVRCISSAHGNRAHTLLQPADVVGASVAALQREPEVVAEFFVRHPDAFVVIDEAHHAAAKSYQALITAARKARKVEILGLTATPTRTIDGELGLLRSAFPLGILFSVETESLIAAGILARPICESVPTGLDFESEFTRSEAAFTKRFGELSPATLHCIASQTSRNALIANRYQQFADEYGQTLIFAASVAHCYTLAEELRSRGIRADYVAYHRDDARTNEAVLSAFRAKELDVVLTVTKLTEGFDLPSIATVFLARPTGSRILLNQMVGRGMRGTRAEGGTSDVRVVSFDDQWTRFSDWLDPIEFLDAPISDRPDRDPVTKEMVDVPWAVYLEIARLSRVDPGQVGGVENRPVGWFDLTASPVEAGGRRTVVVYQHHRDGYDALIDDLVEGAPRENTASLLPWYFSAIASLPSTAAVDAVISFVNETGKAPPFFPFEVMDLHSPEAVARSVAELTIDQATKAIEQQYDAHPMVKVLFPDRRLYAEAVFDALLDPRFGAENFTEYTVVDLSQSKLTLPPGDFDLQAIAREVSDRMSLGVDVPAIRWATKPKRSYWAIYYSPPDEILVNPVLKTSAVRQETIEFLVYHELLHHHLGVDEGHSLEFRRRERLFAGWYDAEAELDTLQERFRLDGARRSS